MIQDTVLKLNSMKNDISLMVNNELFNNVDTINILHSIDKYIEHYNLIHNTMPDDVLNVILTLVFDDIFDDKEISIVTKALNNIICVCNKWKNMIYDRTVYRQQLNLTSKKPNNMLNNEFIQ